jgi:hypothetical protein
MTERHFMKRMRITGRLDALDAAAQTRKRVYACAGHVRRPYNFGHCWFLNEPATGSLVHDMFYYKANRARGVNGIGASGDS